MTVICPECGQALIVSDELWESGTPEDVLALKTCNCPAARAWRNKQSQIVEALLNIEELCVSYAENLNMTQIDNENILDILRQSVKLIADCEVSDITVKTVSHGTIKVSGKGAGSIIVKRAVSHSEELKANPKH